MTMECTPTHDAVSTETRRRTTVREVMRPATAIEAAAHLAAAVYVLKHVHDGALVVVNAATEEPVATIGDTEIRRAIADGRDPEVTRVSQILTARQESVEADDLLEDAARLMRSHDIERLPVLANHQLVGILELADLPELCSGREARTAEQRPL